MKKLLLSLMLIPALALNAQELQNFMQQGRVVSPEITAQNVTFRLSAPDASNVALAGSWAGYTAAPVAMTKDANGVWSYTMPLPETELYSYSFVVDGVRMNDPVNTFQQRDGNNYLSVLLIPGDLTENYFEASGKRGNLSEVWYDSPTLGLNRRMLVYTPYGYNDPGNTQKYPVLYLLHGGGGDEEAWSSMGRTRQIMDNLISKGQAVPMIVVMPNGNPTQSAANYLGLPVKQVAQGSMSSTAIPDALVNDVIPFVDSRFRTVANSDGRAIAGLSMGGGHTVNTTLRHPGVFGYICPMSGGGGDSGDRKDEYRKLNGTYKLYWIGCGDEDFAYPGIQTLDNTMTELGMPHTMFINGGGHTWSNWRIYLNTFGKLLFK